MAFAPTIRRREDMLFTQPVWGQTPQNTAASMMGSYLMDQGNAARQDLLGGGSVGGPVGPSLAASGGGQLASSNAPSLSMDRPGGGAPGPPAYGSSQDFWQRQEDAVNAARAAGQRAASNRYVGGFAKMPGAFYDPAPGGSRYLGGTGSTEGGYGLGPSQAWSLAGGSGWGGPGMRRVTGAADIMARMAQEGMLGLDPNKYTQQWADDLQANMLQQMRDAAAGGGLDYMSQQWLNEYDRQMAQFGYYDPTQSEMYSQMYDSGLNDPRFPEGGSAEDQTRYYDDKLQAFIRQWQDPNYTTPPYAGWGLGEEPSASQLSQANQQFRDWWRRTYGVDPETY